MPLVVFIHSHIDISVHTAAFHCGELAASIDSWMKTILTVECSSNTKRMEANQAYHSPTLRAA